MDSPRLWSEAVAVLVGHGIGGNSADIARRAAHHLDRHPTRLPLILARKDPDGRGAKASQALAELLT